jgi:basic membrane protein A
LARSKILAVAIAVSVSLLASACGGKSNLGSANGNSKGSAKRVALVVAQGGLGDESYNDLANAGFKKGLAETGLSGSPIESTDVVGQGEQILRRAGQTDFGLVVDLEFSHGQILPKVASDFPDTKWAIVNTEAKGSNVASVLFQEQDGSFLAGALAAMMTTDTANPRVNPDKTIGVIGGTKSVGIDKFIVGYIQGAKAVDPNINVLVSYANTFGDPTKGQQLAQAMFQQGADVVYAVAGGTGAGVIKAAQAANKYAIGVDTDQDALAKGNVLTSMVKHTDLAVAQLVKNYKDNQYPGGQTLTLGLKDGGVGLSAFTYTKQDIPPQDLTNIERMRQQIISGQIQVWNAITQGYPPWFKG